MTQAAATPRWAGTRWAHEPHVRVGDPCYQCGIPMVPASRCWTKDLLPAGHRVHGSHGVCSRCKNRLYKTGVLPPRDDQHPASGDPHRRTS